MPKPYADPSFNTTVGLFEHVNSITQGWALILFTMALYIVIFSLLKKRFYETADSLLVASILTFVFASFLWGMGLVAGKIPIAYLILTLFAGIYQIFSQN